MEADISPLSPPSEPVTQAGLLASSSCQAASGAESQACHRTWNTVPPTAESLRKLRLLAASGLGRSAGETQAIDFESGPPRLQNPSLRVSHLVRVGRCRGGCGGGLGGVSPPTRDSEF